MKKYTEPKLIFNSFDKEQLLTESGATAHQKIFNQMTDPQNGLDASRIYTVAW